MWTLHGDFAVAVFLLCQLCGSLSFNVDLKQARIYQGPAGSYFGVSVALHRTLSPKQSWMVVGAPRARDPFQPSLATPGAVFKCPPDGANNSSCSQLVLDVSGDEVSDYPSFADNKTNMALGISVDSNPTPGGNLVACAHNWRDVQYAHLNHDFVYGLCYEVANSLSLSTVKKWRPLLELFRGVDTQTGDYYYGMGLAGMSAHYTGQGSGLLLGSPGVQDWRGAVIRLGYSHIMDEDPEDIVDRFGYLPYSSLLGYSISSGHLSHVESLYIVVGAPRADGVGKVFMYPDSRKGDNIEVQIEKRGKMMGSYYGGSVCVVDINNDSLDDLLVGAPLYGHDQGQVYVYINRDLLRLEETAILGGSEQYGARFGTAISTVGDLNADSFPDVVIGAPNEDDQRGAIYIYYGSTSGLRQPFSQRIAGRALNENLRGFGYSLTRGMDMDENGHSDFGVGSHLSDQAVLFSGRPVVAISSDLVLSTEKISLKEKQCADSDNMPLACIEIRIFLSYSANGNVPNIVVNYKLESDVLKPRSPRALLMASERSFRGHVWTRVESSVSRQARLSLGETGEHVYYAVMPGTVKDVLTPMVFRLSYSMDLPTDCTLCPVLDAFRPTHSEMEAFFVNECGDDNICITDLAVAAEARLPGDKKSIVLGNREPVLLIISLNNFGEQAYLTSVDISYPEGIQFIQHEGFTGPGIMRCQPIKMVGNSTADHFRLHCEAHKAPLPANSMVSFVIKLDTSNYYPSDYEIGDLNELHYGIPDLGAVHRGMGKHEIKITANVSTQSTELEYENNRVEVAIPVNVEADFSITGVSKPEQITYTVKKDSLYAIVNETEYTRHMITSSKTEGIPLRHVYDMRNIGPGLMPTATIMVNIPYATQGGKPFFKIQAVEISDDDPLRDITASCHEVNSRGTDHLNVQKREILTTTHVPVIEKPAIGESSIFSDKAKSTTFIMDCGNSEAIECKTYQCTVGKVKAGDGILLTVHGKLMLSAITHLHVPEMQLVTDTILYTVSGDSTEISQKAKVLTPLFPRSHVQTSVLPWWVLFVSVAVGWVLFMILAIILWKCGFFRRKAREELQRLLENEEDVLVVSPTSVTPFIPQENFFSDDYLVPNNEQMVTYSNVPNGYGPHRNSLPGRGQTKNVTHNGPRDYIW